MAECKYCRRRFNEIFFEHERNIVILNVWGNSWDYVTVYVGLDIRECHLCVTAPKGTFTCYCIPCGFTLHSGLNLKRKKSLFIRHNVISNGYPTSLQNALVEREKSVTGEPIITQQNLGECVYVLHPIPKDLLAG